MTTYTNNHAPYAYMHRTCTCRSILAPTIGLVPFDTDGETDGTGLEILAQNTPDPGQAYPTQPLHGVRVETQISRKTTRHCPLGHVHGVLQGSCQNITW